MDIKINARNCEIKKVENDYIVEKVENLSRFNLNLKSVNVNVKKEGYGVKIELFLNALAKNFMMEKKGETIMEVIDIIVEKMAVNLIKHKDKIKDHKALKLNTLIEEKDFNAVEVIYKSKDSLEVLSNSDAIDKLVNSEDTFLVYKEMYSESINVAVKKNGIIEIIEG